MNWKRIALLIGFLAAVVLVSYGLYFVFLRPSIPTEPTPGVNGNVNGGGLPQAGVNGNIPIAGDVNGNLQGAGNVNVGSQIVIPGQAPSPDSEASDVASGGLTRTNTLTNSRVYQTTLSSDGDSILFYDRTSGQFYRIDADGNRVSLSDKVFHEVENVTWSPDREQAVLEYPDGSNIVYNFSTGEQNTLPQHWKDFSFSTNGNQLVLKSMGIDEQNRWLAVSNPDGSQAKKIEPLGNKDATVYTDWSPNNQIIAMYTENKDFDRQELFFVGLNGENFRSTTIEGRGLQHKWSKDGSTLLYSVYSSASDYKPTLWIVNGNPDSIGQNRRSLRLQTWADKCNFGGGTTVYCAVPRELREGAGIFANDLDTSPTDIYKIDIETGIRTKIATPEGDKNINNIFVSSDNNYAYFTDKDTGQLHSIRLQ